jgi:hypothetical protein
MNCRKWCPACLVRLKFTPLWALRSLIRAVPFRGILPGG